MQSTPQPLRFSHHAISVLGAAMLGSTIFALISIAALALLARAPMPLSWYAVLTLACWFAIFVFALPGAAVLFSLLWPVTRRGTAGGAWICVIAGATLGVVLAPLGAGKMAGGASWTQIALLALIGAVIGALYVGMARRMTRGAGQRRTSPRGFRHRLSAVTEAMPAQP